MKTIHDAEVRVAILDRLRQWTPESERRWGTMTAAQALFHVNAGIRMALGELHAEPVGNPAFWHTEGKSIALAEEPWPEGAPTSKEALAVGPVSFEEERAAFPLLLDRLASRPEEGPWPRHPRFGPLTGTEWSRLTYTHVDHHFRQFGV
jgi:hypothetical protein